MDNTNMNFNIRVNDKELTHALKKAKRLITDLDNPNLNLKKIMKWVLISGVISIAIELTIVIFLILR